MDDKTRLLAAFIAGYTTKEAGVGDVLDYIGDKTSNAYGKALSVVDPDALQRVIPASALPAAKPALWLASQAKNIFVPDNATKAKNALPLDRTQMAMLRAQRKDPKLLLNMVTPEGKFTAEQLKTLKPKTTNKDKMADLFKTMKDWAVKNKKPLAIGAGAVGVGAAGAYALSRYLKSKKEEEKAAENATAV